MPSPKPVSILNLEEDTVIRLVIADAFIATGYDVLSVGTIEEAENTIEQRRRPIDLMIIDGTVHGQDGIELCARIRTFGYKGIIVIQSGYSDNERLQRAMRAGANDYLFKPFRMGELADRIDRLLGLQRRGVIPRSETGRRRGARPNAKSTIAKNEELLSELRPLVDEEMPSPAAGHNHPPSDLPISKEQAANLQATLDSIKTLLRERFPDPDKVVEVETELLPHINRFGGWLGKVPNLAAEEAAKTVGRLSIQQVCDHASELYAGLLHLFALLKWFLYGH